MTVQARVLGIIAYSLDSALFALQPISSAGVLRAYDVETTISESGWCVEHRGNSIFVADSQWTYCEKYGQPTLHCARLNVFTYRFNGNRRR
jgi:hypothetical protein